MTRNDFKEGSVEQILFDHWDNCSKTESQTEGELMDLDKQELVDFILLAQTRGRFAEGYCHP